MTEDPKGNESKKTGFVVSSTALDGDMKMPRESPGIDPEAQRRATLRRLLVRFRPGDRVDRNDGAMPSGGARPPTQMLKRLLLSPEEPLQIATARPFSTHAPQSSRSCSGQRSYDPRWRCTRGTACSRPLESLWETCAEQRLLFSRHSPLATRHSPLATRHPPPVCTQAPSPFVDFTFPSA